MNVPSARSSSIFCVARRLGLLVLLALLAAPAAHGAKNRQLEIEDLTNFLLGPEYSQWLVGAVSRIASDEERQAYLTLTSDEAARAFIDAFWERRRDPSRPWPQEQPRGTFERRAREADRLFTEGTVLGRRSARGEVHVLFGPPANIDYIPAERPFKGNIEIWSYPREVEAPRLSGEPPSAQYFFVRMGEQTVRYSPRVRDLRRRRSGLR